ncbi:hypothetical protein FisN_14Lh273 [Fistulifera solaris]|uniref:DUF305 domain-containing protein n=1 Tax=Fistulifera solaris TaxID=1519565 RepID=A0A1Z5J9S7_FISSO|nr:hypothetical protein FisN_14Lh273 [Fistulifera solaris]|eukprot:GAX10753.1 hypothetical protein FisN_14Lh273 [Fistulifera solaris]
MKFVVTSLVFWLAASPSATAQGIDCVATCAEDVCTFTAKVNLYAGELGYFTFEECGDIRSPTLGIEVGKTYRFVQADRTNYYHPLGFAYFPDGAHADKDELEPSIVPPGSSSTCNTTETCPAPKYFQDGVYLGDWMHQDSSIDSTGDFGLDHYEPKFFYPLGDWLGFGTFEVQLTFDVEDFAQDLFYFCHIHEFMTGRIKLMNEAGEPLVAENVPVLEYTYDEVDAFDETCGTFNTSSYRLPDGEFAGQCPERFVCETAESRFLQSDGNASSPLQAFSTCLDAMNCAMMVGMTTHATSPIGLFIHQMIPHHQNAVNMAKALLKTGGMGTCEDLTNEEDPNCIMEYMMYEIINNQNHQIQTMRAVLETLQEPAYADCVVTAEHDHEEEGTGSDDVVANETSTNGESTISSGAWTLGHNLFIVLVAALWILE